MRFKKLISIAISFIVVLSSIVFAQTTAFATTFNDINQPSVFVKQQVKGTCTLASSVMLVRRASMINGNNNWSAITESSMKSTAWVNNMGLLWNFTYSGITVNHNTLSGGISNKSALIILLANHPEGIVAYNSGNSDQYHAILLTDYTNGTFYCADPAGSSSGRVPIINSTIKGADQDEKIGNFNAYWYVSAPKVSLNPLNHTHSYTLVWTESQHPHKNVYKCSCGAGYTDTNSVNYSDNCNTCKSPVINDGWYKIALNKNQKYVVDVAESSTKSGQNVQLLQYNKNFNQQKMYFKYVGDGFYNIYFYHSKKVLDVKGGTGLSKSNVQQWDSNGSIAQQWALLPTGNGSYYVKSRSGNIYLDLYSNKVENGTNLWVYSPNYSSAQKWNLIPVSKKVDYNVNGGKKEIVKLNADILGFNTYREKDQMVVFNKSGCTTGTNTYGVEALVNSNNKVTEIRPYGQGNATVPENGFVVSGHNKMRKWINKNIKLGDYITYNAKDKEITVYKDYNSFKLENTNVLDNQKIGELPNIKRAGYSFEGWHTAKSGGELITAETINPTSTLYAHWKLTHQHKLVLKNQKKATYFSNGYSGNKVCSICEEIIIKGISIPKLILKKPKFKANSGKNYFNVTYYKVQNATGYQISYKKGKKTIIKTYRNKNSAKKSFYNLKKGKYTVSVRAFVKKGKKRAFSNWTKPKKIKVR